MIAESALLAENESWLTWRRGGIGSSDAPAIAGLDPYRGPLAVWLDKTSRVPLESPQSEAARWGHLLEDAICKEFETRTGLFVPVRQRMVENPQRGWLRATIDGFVHELPPGLHSPGDVSLGPLEIKTVAGFKSDAWAVTSENPTGVPDHFRIQVLHQLGVTDMQHAWIAVLFGGQRLEIRELERDEEDLAALLDLEEAFWARVLSGVPPAGDGSTGSTEALRAAYTNGGAAPVVLPVEAGEILLERERAKAEEKLAATRAAAAEQTVMAWLGEAELGMYDGQPRVTWKRSERTSVDVDGLRAENPDLARRFTKATPLRTLRFVGSKADSGGD